MICEKCGIEFHEGRNCPNCGALAIFVKEDEYQSRKQEWEEENAPREETTKKKLQINIHVDPVIVRRIVILAAVICVVLTAGIWIVGRVRKFFNQEQYVLVYDNGTNMSADSRSFSEYVVEDAVYSTDGNYVYPNHFPAESVQGEIISQYVSPSGEYGAVISMEGTDTASYYLYAVRNTQGKYAENDAGSTNEGCELVKSGTNEIRIIEVTGEGNIYYEEAELGAYNVVLSTALYLYDGEKSKLVAENVHNFVSCENENEFIYYDSDLQAYLYSEGNITVLNEGRYGYEYVCTSEGAIYYLTPKGELYMQGRIGSIDRGITSGSLMAAANSEKVVYAKDGALYCYGGSIKTPVVLLEDYDLYEGRCRVIEKHDKIYYAYEGKLYMVSKSGKNVSTKDGIEGVFFSFK